MSSGREVAKPTTVIPITSLEILNFKEIATEDLTINSPPTTKSKKPKKKNNTFILSHDYFKI